jgi:MSHA biogenesis protein MshO
MIIKRQKIKSSANFDLVKNSGFSLLELIIVIILIGIMSISFGKLTSNTVIGYIDAKDRNRLSQSAKWVTEKISREIREALPQSIRTGSSGNFHCVEFLPIVNASTTIGLPNSGSINNFNAANYNITTSSASLVAMMPINTNSIYNSTGVLANVTSIITSVIDPLQATINLTSATTFTNRSPQNRFYLLNSPVSFCLNNGNGHILRYQNYGLSSSQSFPPTGGNTLAENFFVNGTVFNYQNGTLSRAGLLQVSLHLQNRGRSLSSTEEILNVFHEVHIRNVP